MTARGAAQTYDGPCDACLRRAWLLTALAGPLDYHCRDRERLLDALALDDEQLICALGGRRRSELARSHAALTSRQLRDGEAARRAQPVCRHQASFPATLRFAAGPRTLYAIPESRRLCGLARGPVVAVLGSHRASDYGIEVARSLARGLAAAGVAVASIARDGICAAALAGALDADGAALCAVPGGVDVPASGLAPAMRERIAARGCLLSEVPYGAPHRRWTQATSERLVVGVAQLTVIVEAEQSRRELAAVPGRVTSWLSSGTNALLASGARLVRDAQDALELLGAATRAPTLGTGGREALGPWLRGVLDEVSGGRDAPDLLVRGGRTLPEVLNALTELELRQVLVRGDGGRYVPRHHLAGGQSLPAPGAGTQETQARAANPKAAGRGCRQTE